LLDPLLDVIAGFLSAALLAALRTVRPQIGAKKHVIAIIGHFHSSSRFWTFTDDHS
jgi:hypothetical protein